MVKKRLPNNLPGQYTCHLPLPPEMNASGLWDKRSSRFWSRQAQNLKSVVRKYQNLGRLFFESYQEASVKKIANFRDLAIAQAVSHSLINTQYLTLDKNSLTSSSKAYWSTHSFSSLWSDTWDYSHYSYGGYLGSVAFSLLNTTPLDPSTDIINILEHQQNLFWKRLDLHRVPLERKYSEFLRRMKVDVETIKRTEEVLLSLFQKSFQDSDYDLTRRLFSLGITKGEVENLFYKIQKLEVSSELVEVIQSLSDRGLVKKDRRWINQSLSKFIRVCPPGGMNTFYQAIAVESYLKLAQYLLDNFDLYEDLVEWEDRLTTNDLNTLYGYISLVYDSLQLSTPSFLDPSRNYLTRLLWYYSSSQNTYYDSWGRLDRSLNLVKASASISPPKGKIFPLLESRPFTRLDVSLSYKTLFEPNTFYLCSLDSDRKPIALEVEKRSKQITLKLNKIKERFVLTPTPITSPEALETLETHSNLIEVKHVDIESPYQP